MAGTEDEYEYEYESGGAAEVAEAPPEPLLSAALAAEAGRAAPLREPDRGEILADARRLRGRRTGTVIAVGALAVAGIGVGAALLGGDPATRTMPVAGVPAIDSPSPSHFVPQGWPTTTNVQTPPQTTLSAMPTRVAGSPSAQPNGVAGSPWTQPELYSAEYAAGTVGRGVRADIFTNMWFLPGRGVVRVYITDLARKDEYLADMRAVTPDLDERVVEFAQGARSRTACQEEMDRVMRVQHGVPFRIYSVSANIECSELNPGVDDQAAAQAYFDDPAHGFTGTGIAVRAVPGQPVHQLADEAPPTGSARP